MNQQLNTVKVRKPPVLLKGLFLTILVIINSILFFGWVIINAKVEQMVITRTSEYAHSIAKIAAGSSADALFRDDKLQLKTLVVNVVKDPHVIKATIFTESGKIVVESTQADDKPKLTIYTTSDGGNQTTQKTDSLNQTTSYLPFVEAISYQGVTTGWFKIIFNRDKLENNFRQSFNYSKNIILLISALLLAFLFIVIFRFSQKVQKLVSINHRLIQNNAPKIPQNNIEWMDVIYQLSQTQFYQQAKTKHLSVSENPWLENRIINSSLFCFCQFSIQQQQDEQVAICLSQAESYLQVAIQTHGIIYQGNILSGCLIPFLKSANEESLVELIALIHLIKQLLASLPLQITMRSLIGHSDLLVLENDRAEITGLSLSNRSLNKINLISGLLSSDEIIFINFEKNELNGVGEIQSIFKHLQQPHFQLLEIADSIVQQVNRQVNYLKKNNSFV